MMSEELKREAREEFEKKFSQLPGVKERDFINKYIDKATLAERERCAEIARNKDKEIPMTYNSYEVARTEGWNDACEIIAKALNQQNDE